MKFNSISKKQLLSKLLDIFISWGANCWVLVILLLDCQVLFSQLNLSIWQTSVLIFLTVPILVIASLNYFNPSYSSFIILTWYKNYYRKNKLKTFHDLTSDLVDFDQFSENLINCLLCAEDDSFIKHSGFNWCSIISALNHNKSKSFFLRGGSSISQQTVKNLFLYPQKSYFRKLWEVYLTLILEVILSKQRILTIYLNLIQFSPDIFGISKASRYFFDKDVSDLSIEESSSLISVLPNPYIYDVNHPCTTLRKRQQEIISYAQKFKFSKFPQ